MNLRASWHFAAAGAFVAGASLALSGCMVSPGTFTSTLDLRRDGSFTFSYEGQIYLLALSKLADMAQESDSSGEHFTPDACYDDETFEDRDCTEEEIGEQREEWESRAESRKAEAERESAAMRAMFGGIDPADPDAAEDLAARLRRQEGWQHVAYHGDGLFEVKFSISSRAGHDFAFPTFEQFPMSSSFVIANLRKNQIVCVEAPGFAPQAGNSNPLLAMMTGFSGASPGEDKMPPMPEVNGTFRIVTDGRILANNTEEGATAAPGGQVLEWRINKRTQTPPMALIKLGGE